MINGPKRLQNHGQGTFRSRFKNDVITVLFSTLKKIIYSKVYIEHEEEAFILNSIPSIIMIVLEFGNDTGKLGFIFQKPISLNRLRA
jgi:hypothetical protein